MSFMDGPQYFFRIIFPNLSKFKLFVFIIKVDFGYIWNLEVTEVRIIKKLFRGFNSTESHPQLSKIDQPKLAVA